MRKEIEEVLPLISDALKEYVDDRLGLLERRIDDFGEKLRGTPIEAQEVATRYNIPGSGLHSFQVAGYECHPRVFDAYASLLKENARLRRLCGEDEHV